MDYAQQADALFAALQAGDDDAAWRFKWEHPRFQGKTIDDVRAASLGLDDARTVVAAQHSFDSWDDLMAFANARDPEVLRFERAVDAVVAGDAAALRELLRAHPELAHARSTRRHHCTLLHYLGANGVEGHRQRTPPNAIEIATILLDAGADPDALADLYGAKYTTMNLLVSSVHPAQAGLQAQLAELLLDRGASIEGALRTALVFGYADTARALVARGAKIDFIAAAGLGRSDDAARLLGGADARERHIALALAAQHGHADVVRLLLDAGEDPDRYNPEGYHPHATPLHHAALGGHFDAVRVLVERGARLDLEDAIYRATPLGWAMHGRHDAIADYLRERAG